MSYTCPHCGTATELVTSVQVAARLNVGSQAVSNWRSRHADFPAPVYESPSHKTILYDWAQVREWAVENGKVQSREAILAEIDRLRSLAESVPADSGD